MEISVREPTDAEPETFETYPIWSCEKSKFPWTYSSTEQCLIIEGEVTVKTGTGEVSFGSGDLVTFPAGLSCTWIISRAVKKYYTFLD
ncbi:MAG: cupin [Candidatus Marinimicrobia bacterium]|nr:cupin [Candidatus Neomarinimicrobiota bacterium]|tara:strand:+ start:11644 stop:11907 length:264 start_codon:yes stop_codon:yes gene_type:complete